MEARTDFVCLFPPKWGKWLHCSVEQLVCYSNGRITFSFEKPLAYPLRFAFQFKSLSRIVSLQHNSSLHSENS